MKTHVRNSSIILSGALRALWRNSSGKRVLCFHEVASAQNFRRKMIWLKEHYDVVSLEKMRKASPENNTMLAITFDDGYASWHEIAAPILESLEMPATFFVCSGFVGLEGEQAKEFIKNSLRRRQELSPLTRTQLVELANHPLFEIGSHTAHHLDLSRSHDEKTLESEIHGDRQQLQEWSGTDVRWFAYPFGMPQHLSVQAINYIKTCSFVGAFTLIPQFWGDETSKWSIGRDGLAFESSCLLWQAWLRGGYDFLYGMKNNIFPKQGKYER